MRDRGIQRTSHLMIMAALAMGLVAVEPPRVADRRTLVIETEEERERADEERRERRRRENAIERETKRQIIAQHDAAAEPYRTDRERRKSEAWAKRQPKDGPT